MTQAIKMMVCPSINDLFRPRNSQKFQTNSKRIFKRISKRIPKRIPDRIPEKIPERIPTHASTKTPDVTVSKVTKGTPLTSF